MDKPLRLTAEQIEALRSPKGGFTRQALASVGIPWPPPPGWKRMLLEGPPADPSPIRTKLSAHELLRQVVMAVVEAGHASDLYAYPDVLEHFGARRDARPTYHASEMRAVDEI